MSASTSKVIVEMTSPATASLSDRSIPVIQISPTIGFAAVPGATFEFFIANSDRKPSTVEAVAFSSEESYLTFSSTMQIFASSLVVTFSWKVSPAFRPVVSSVSKV